MVYMYVSYYKATEIIAWKFLRAFCPLWRCGFTASSIPQRLGHGHIKSSIGNLHVRCNCNLKSHDVVMYLQCRRQLKST